MPKKPNILCGAGSLVGIQCRLFNVNLARSAGCCRRVSLQISGITLFVFSNDTFSTHSTLEGSRGGKKHYCCCSPALTQGYSSAYYEIAWAVVSRIHAACSLLHSFAQVVCVTGVLFLYTEHHRCVKPRRRKKTRLSHFGGFLLGRKKRESESVMSGRVGRVIPP